MNTRRSDTIAKALEEMIELRHPADGSMVETDVNAGNHGAEQNVKRHQRAHQHRDKTDAHEQHVLVAH